MHIFINQQPVDLAQPRASVADALAQWNARPPYAVALNTQFVPKSQYASQALHEGDQLEVISPVTGG